MSLMFAQKTISGIAVNGNNLIVTRVVITLSDKTEWSYAADTGGHAVKVQIYNCESANPQTQGLNTSSLVKQITTVQNKDNCAITLDLSGAFYIETMALENPYRIVLDLFKAKRSYNLDEIWAQAEFYEKAGKLIPAGKEYAKASRRFPDNKDTCFLWGRLMLRQQNYEKAKDKFRSVPEKSVYYGEAQRFLTMLINNDYSGAEQAVKPVEAAPEIVTAKTDKAETAVAEPVVEEQCGGSWKPCSIVQRRVLGMPIWGWLIVVLILAIALLLIVDLKRLMKDKKAQKLSNSVSVIQNEALKLKMVKKLMESGWNASAIARELMLSEKEVQALLKQAERNLPDEDE